MTPELAVELRRDLNLVADRTSRIEEREVSRDESIKDLKGDVRWILRGVIAVLLVAAGELILLLVKK